MNGSGLLDLGLHNPGGNCGARSNDMTVTWYRQARQRQDL